MNTRSRLALVFPLILAACTTPGKLPDRLATANIVTSAGQPAGTATILAEGERLSLALSLARLPAGEHGLHLHAAGLCDGPGFTSAAAHLNPLGRQHGLHNPAGPHLGDLPNVMVDADGSASVTIPLPFSREELATAIFDGDGTAILIHASPDDYRTDPSGNSGARIACGAFIVGK